MKFLLALCIFYMSLFSDVKITKSITLSKVLYKDTGSKELREIALKKVKAEAIKEIFGEFLLSHTTMQNGNIIDDNIDLKYGGVIRIKGEPHFEESEDSIKVTIDAYASQKDIDDSKPQKIVIRNFCFCDPNLAMNKIRQTARDALILEAISTKKPSVSSVEAAKKIAIEVEITNEKFDFDTFNYYLDGVVTYLPISLSHVDKITTKKSNLKKEKKDFFGSWSGFLMGKDGSSCSVKVDITNFAQATILYKTLKCGGDLIIQDQDSQKIVFKEIITFGKDRCKSKATISLNKVTPKSLELSKTEDKKQIYTGRIYFQNFQ